MQGGFAMSTHKEGLVVPKKLKEARLKAGLTQVQLANKVGLHPVTIAKWEIGMHQPLELVLRALADELGVKVAYLKGESDPGLTKIKLPNGRTQSTWPGTVCDSAAVTAGMKGTGNEKAPLRGPSVKDHLTVQSTQVPPSRAGSSSQDRPSESAATVPAGSGRPRIRQAARCAWSL